MLASSIVFGLAIMISLNVFDVNPAYAVELKIELPSISKILHPLDQTITNMPILPIQHLSNPIPNFNTNQVVSNPINNIASQNSGVIPYHSIAPSSITIPSSSFNTSPPISNQVVSNPINNIASQNSGVIPYHSIAPSSIPSSSVHIISSTSSPYMTSSSDLSTLPIMPEVTKVITNPNDLNNLLRTGDTADAQQIAYQLSQKANYLRSLIASGAPKSTVESALGDLKNFYDNNAASLSDDTFNGLKALVQDAMTAAAGFIESGVPESVLTVPAEPVFVHQSSLGSGISSGPYLASPQHFSGLRSFH
ncbi:MAG: hypothetical protein ACREBB_10230 [Nitrosotalea sp.]